MAVDRAAAEKALQDAPDARGMAQGNRLFLCRVVHYLTAECGIRQFVDNAFGSEHLIEQDQKSG